MTERRVAIVGAGPSGVAAAVALRDRGIRALVLDRADEVAAAWRVRYDRLRLNTCRPFSHLPGRRFPRGTPMFPSRDQLVAHVEKHAREAGIELRLATSVERIERERGRWTLHTSGGEVTAPSVIVATGYEGQPMIPDWEGRERFSGRLLHASEYRRPAPFAGQSVLVVGPGCSGMEIAYDLAEGGASKVWLSARTPPNIVLRQGPGPVPGDMMGVFLLRFPSRVGDAVARFGQRMDFGDLSEQGPAVVDPEVIDAIRAGRIEVVRGVESLDESGVTLADGARVEPDSVICATAYRRALEPLVGHLGVLDPDGAPRTLSPNAAMPGLRFGGYVSRPGAIGYMGKEARRAARAIERELG